MAASNLDSIDCVKNAPFLLRHRRTIRLLHDLAEYTGEFSAFGFTVSVGQYGVWASYFWNPQKGPLSSGNVKSASLGYAPGAQLSCWWSVTNIHLIG
jgi:hypothetical protein